MGHTGDASHPEVQEAIAHVIARTAAAGKAPGLFGTDPAKFDDYVKLGVRMLAVGADSLVLGNGLRSLAAGTSNLG